MPLRQKKIDPQVAALVFRYGAPVACVVEHHSSLGRCRDRLLEMLEKEEQQGIVIRSGTVVSADQLTASTGRFQRAWHAPPGGIWFSMIWADSLLPDFSRFIPFALGISLCEAVRSFQIMAQLKWVNDLHFEDKKLGGILCETVRSGRGDLYHVLGIGLNANNSQFPPELSGTSVSMQHILGREVDLQTVYMNIFAQLTWNIGLLHYLEQISLEEKELPENLQPLSIWRSLSDSIGRRVRYGFNVQETPLFEATVCDIDQQGGIVMQLDDSSLLTEYGGEIEYITRS